MRDDDILSLHVSDRPAPTVAQRASSTSELYAASQSLFKKSAPSSSLKNEATILPDIIRPFPEAQPRKPASKSRKKVQNPDRHPEQGRNRTDEIKLTGKYKKTAEVC
jgi:hypothetical protein